MNTFFLNDANTQTETQETQEKELSRKVQEMELKLLESENRRLKVE